VADVEGGAGLVEDQDAGLADEHAGEHDALTLAAAEGADAALGEGVEVEAMQRGGDGGAVAGRGGAEGREVGGAAEEDEVADAEVEGEAAALREVGELAGALARREDLEVDVAEEDAAALRRGEAGELAQEGRLAGAVGADDGGDPPGRSSRSRPS
jgi:hypothetical protein